MLSIMKWMPAPFWGLQERVRSGFDSPCGAMSCLCDYVFRRSAYMLQQNLGPCCALLSFYAFGAAVLASVVAMRPCVACSGRAWSSWSALVAFGVSAMTAFRQPFDLRNVTLQAWASFPLNPKASRKQARVMSPTAGGAKRGLGIRHGAGAPRPPKMNLGMSHGMLFQLKLCERCQISYCEVGVCGLRSFCCLSPPMVCACLSVWCFSDPLQAPELVQYGCFGLQKALEHEPLNRSSSIMPLPHESATAVGVTNCTELEPPHRPLPNQRRSCGCRNMACRPQADGAAESIGSQHGAQLLGANASLHGASS